MSESEYAPWYVVAYRIPWFLVYQAALAVCVLCVFCTNGKEPAATFWKNNV